MAKTISKTHSSYWMDDNLWDIDEDSNTEKDTFLRIFKLSAARRATANFVNILTGRNDINVTFSSGKESYTNGQAVVISADDNPDNFDSMVGLALHEAAHILLSDFDFLKYITEIRNVLNKNSASVDAYWDPVSPVISVGAPAGKTVMWQMMHPSLVKKLPLPQDYVVHMENNERAYNKVVVQYLDHIKILMNLLEDRRIDQYVYRTCGGYRPYYDALYAKYMFTDDVSRNLRWNPEWRKITVDNYINRLLLSFHPHANPNALPGLKKLIKMMDLDNIDRIVQENDSKWRHYSAPMYEYMPTLWKIANELYVEILKYVKNSEEFSPSTPQIPQPQIQLPTNGTPSDLPNLDLPNSMGEDSNENSSDGMGGDSNENSSDEENDWSEREVEPAEIAKNGKEKARKFNEKRGNTMLNALRDLTNGITKKKKISRADLDATQAVEDAAAKMMSIGGDGVPDADCLVTRKLTERVFNQNWFLFGGRWVPRGVTEAIAAGKRMGRILENKLQVRNDPVTTKYTRLQTGSIDRRLLANLGMDIVDIFHKNRIDSYKPAMLHLTIDASGSMHGGKWEKVITVATALAYVSSKVRNVDAVISLRGGEVIPMVAIIFDSRTNTFAEYMKWVGRLAPAGATPEGLCFKATMDLILENTKTHDVYFINFSDGEPSFWVKSRGKTRRRYNSGDLSYCREFAGKHTKTQVQNMRDHGVKILSYFITQDSGKVNEHNPAWVLFKQMYGEDATYVNVQNATQVLKTLNKRLTQKL